MDLSRAVYSRDLKIAAMRALDAGSDYWRNRAQISTEPETAGTLARRVARPRGAGFPRHWAARRRSAGAGRCPPHRRVGAQNRPAHDGERFFKKSLAAFQGSSPAGRRQWRGCLFEEIQQAAAKGQAVNALCQMTGISRAGFYRWRVPRQATRSRWNCATRCRRSRWNRPPMAIAESPANCSGGASRSITNACCG